MKSMRLGDPTAVVLIWLLLAFFQSNCSVNAGPGNKGQSEVTVLRSGNTYKIGNTQLGLVMLATLPDAFRNAPSSETLLAETDSYIWVSEGNKLWKLDRSSRTWEVVYENNSKKKEGAQSLIDLLYCFDDASCAIKIGNELTQTNDAGRTWSEASSNPLSRFLAVESAVSMPQNHAAILYGEQEVPAKPDERGISGGVLSADGKKILSPLMLRSDDAGKSWREFRFAHVYGGIQAAQFLNPTFGWALSRWQPLKIEDGLTFRTLKPQEVDAEPTQISLLDKNTGWISYSDGVTYRTSDGGATWELINRGPFQDHNTLLVQDLTFISPTIGLGVVDDKSHDKELLFTMDGGRTWGPAPELPQISRVFKIAFDHNRNSGLILTAENLIEYVKK